MKRSKLAEINLMWLFIFTVPLFIGAIIVSPYSPKLQFMILSLAAMVYFCLALLHHHKDKSLNVEVILEYFLIAALSLLIVQSLVR
jgi:hypothetical protein